MKYPKTLVVLALAIAASGCSQPREGRAFEVPDSLCGTHVSPDLLSPVLPESGKSIEVRRSTPDMKGALSCKVVVDGTIALTAGWSWMAKGKTPRSVAYDNPYLKIAEYEGGDGAYVYSSTGGVSRVTCEPVVAHRKGAYELFAQIFVSDGEKAAPAMEKLLQAYAKGLATSPECVQT